MSTLHKVFVYGTLKQGQPNHYLLLEASGSGVARLLGEAELTERYPMIIHEDCGIPVLLDKSGDGKIVKGELYEVDDTTLKNSLDELEDHPNLYKRMPTQCHIIAPHRERDIKCETYIMQNFTDDALRRDHHNSYDHSECSVRVQASRDRTEDEKAAVRKALYSLKRT